MVFYYMVWWSLLSPLLPILYPISKCHLPKKSNQTLSLPKHIYSLSILYRGNCQSLTTLSHSLSTQFRPLLFSPTHYHSLCLLDHLYEYHAAWNALPHLFCLEMTFLFISTWESFPWLSISSVFHSTCVLSTRTFSYICLNVAMLPNCPYLLETISAPSAPSSVLDP